MRVTLGGGASHGVTEAGALARLRKIAREHGITIDGYGGASVGGLLAILAAMGVDDEDIKDLFFHLLQRDRVLDWAFPDLEFGLCRWEVIPREIDRRLGPGLRFCDAKTALVVGVADVTDARMRYLSVRDTPHVLISEAARATSAFPGAAPIVPIPSLFPDITHGFSDAGNIDNVCDAVFDDPASPPRLAIRLVDSTPERMSMNDASYPHAMRALFRASRVATNLHKSKRSDGLNVDVEANGDGLDFSLTPTQLRTRYANGEAAMEARRDDIVRIFGATHAN